MFWDTEANIGEMNWLIGLGMHRTFVLMFKQRWPPLKIHFAVFAFIFRQLMFPSYVILQWWFLWKQHATNITLKTSRFRIGITTTFLMRSEIWPGWEALTTSGTLKGNYSSRQIQIFINTTHILLFRTMTLYIMFKQRWSPFKTHFTFFTFIFRCFMLSRHMIFQRGLLWKQHSTDITLKTSMVKGG